MYSQEYGFTAVHEAGHAVCIAQFPPANTAVTSLAIPYPEILSPRIMEIEIWYDEEKERYDGWTLYSLYGLKDKQLLFIALGGRVAELMARTEGNWDITAIQTRILGGEYGDTLDMRHVSSLLSKINEDNRRERLTETVSSIFSFLEENWDLVNQVAADLLSMYNPVTFKARISYDDLSPETKAQLMQLRDNRQNPTNG